MTRRLLILIWLGGSASWSGAAESVLTPDQDAVVRRIEAAWVAYEPDRAAAILDSVLPGAEATADTTYLIRLIVRRGHMNAARGEGAAAIPDLRRALELARARRDTLYTCTALRWLAVAEGALGHTEEACAIWDRLLDLARRSRDRPHEAWALSGRGYCAQLGGRSAEAADGYRESAERFHALRILGGEMFARNSLGTAYQELGRYGEARSCYQRTGELADSSGDLHFQAVAENNLGVLEYFLADPGRALAHFHRAVELHGRFGNRRERLRAALNVVICEVERGRTRPALEELQRLLEEARGEQYRDLEGEVLSEIATVHRLQGRRDLAAATDRSLLLESGRLPVTQELETVLELSRCLVERDSLAAAIRLLRARESWASSLEDPRLRLALQTELGRDLLRQGDAEEAYQRLRSVERDAEKLPLRGPRLFALAPLARAAQRLGRIEEALQWARSAAWLWEEMRSQPLDPDWREIQGGQAREISTVLAGLLLEADPEATPTSRVERAYDELQRFKARTLMERTLGPGRRADSSEVRPVTLALLQRDVLRRGELFLDYYLGPDRSYLFAIDTDTCRVVVLPAEWELEPMVRDFCELLRSGAEQGRAPWPADERRFFDAAVAAMRARLLPALDPLLGDRERLFFSPDGALNLVPLSLLVTDPSGDSLRRSTATCQSIPSAGYLGWIRRPGPAGGTAGGILAWCGRQAPEGRHLHGPEAEVRALDRRFLRVDRGDEMAPESLLRRLPRYELLHLAGHSRIDDQAPWLSAISLDRRGDSTGLRAEEIAEMRLSARLVVLSSCASAGGRILSGEGVQGLTSAFLSAGVPTVLATLWPVDDAATAEWIELFYAELARGAAPGLALRRAQESLGSSPDRAHPFYWAGFILVGDGEARPVLEPSVARRVPRSAFLSVIAGGAVLVVLRWILRRRRRGL